MEAPGHLMTPAPDTLTDIAVLGGAYRGVLKLTPSILTESILLPTVRLAAIVVALLGLSSLQNAEAKILAQWVQIGPDGNSSVRAIKGPSRPINSIEARATVLAALEVVDYLTVFEESTPLELIQALRPDVLVKGADYRRDQVVGGDFVESYGGRVHLADLREGYSTTRLLQQLGAA